MAKNSKRFGRSPSHRVGNDEWCDDAEQGVSDVIAIDPETDLVGSVYKVPDNMWGFRAVGRIEHPGACTSCDIRKGLAVLLKGTDARSGCRDYRNVVVLEASQSNGLTKATAFAIEPRPFRIRKVALLHPDRQIGKLEPNELDQLQTALMRVFSKP